MAGEGGFLDGLTRRRAVRAWARAARGAESAEPAELRRQLRAARDLRRHLDRLVHVADGRLARMGGDEAAPTHPPGTDWAWRPEIWSGPLPDIGRAPAPAGSWLGFETRLFHDCPRAEIALRQVRTPGQGQRALHGLQIDVFGFDGSYLSLAIELPQEAAQGLRKRHVVVADALIETERPLEAFARLNIRHGPNTEQVARELRLGEGPAVAEFDLAYTRLNERRTERLWLDLIFERPEMSQILLRDVALSRRVRAEF